MERLLGKQIKGKNSEPGLCFVSKKQYKLHASSTGIILTSLLVMVILMYAQCLNSHILIKYIHTYIHTYALWDILS